MTVRILMCLVCLLLLASPALASESPGFRLIDGGEVYVDVHRYLENLPVLGITLRTSEWRGWRVEFTTEELFHYGRATGPGDPVNVIPVKTIYIVNVSKRLGENWSVSYNHFSAHWHRLAETWFGHSPGNDDGWYGDTYWRLSYSW